MNFSLDKLRKLYEKYAVIENGKKEVVIMKNTRMRDMENDLRQYNYARANQSFLVNMKYISEIKGDEIILPNTIVFLSRSRKKDFIKQFAFYIGMEI